MLDFPISVKLLTYASRTKEDTWEQWTNDGPIVIEDNTRPISDSMDNHDLENELRSMNKKQDVCSWEKEDLHQRLTMQQDRLQRQETALHSKVLVLKDEEGQFSEL